MEFGYRYAYFVRRCVSVQSEGSAVQLVRLRRSLSVPVGQQDEPGQQVRSLVRHSTVFDVAANTQTPRPRHPCTAAPSDSAAVARSSSMCHDVWCFWIHQTHGPPCVHARDCPGDFLLSVWCQTVGVSFPTRVELHMFDSNDD